MVDGYEDMTYGELRDLYFFRCNLFGVKNPEIPNSKKDLITILEAADMFGVPKEEGVDALESTRTALIRMMQDGLQPEIDIMMH